MKPVSLRTLVCRRDVDLTIHCLRSVLQCSLDPVTLVLHEDGSLTAEDREKIGAMLPGSRVIDRRAADETMAGRLEAHPHARSFRERSVWGLKLLDIVLLENSDCFYLDGDIRFFRPFMGLFTEESVRNRSIFLADTVWEAYSVRPWHLMDRRRLTIQAGINTGLTMIDARLYDLDFVDWFLGQPDWHCIPAWAEPTCWAALASKANGHVVNPAQIVNLYPSARVSEETFGGHFLSSYRQKWTSLLESELLTDAAAITASFLRTISCSPARLLRNQLKRKVTNTLKFHLARTANTAFAA